jgi:hypothetical protein
MSLLLGFSLEYGKEIWDCNKSQALESAILGGARVVLLELVMKAVPAI